MFKRFLEIQQGELDSLGLTKQTQEQRVRMEQQRYDSLKQFHDTLGQYQGTTALCFQNRTAMQRQLGNLLDSQEQEVTLAELELGACQKQLLSQFGKVKGLSRLQQKRDEVQRRKERKQEQGQLDDWLNGTLHTG